MKICFRSFLLVLISVFGFAFQTHAESEAAQTPPTPPGFSYYPLDPDITTNYLSEGKTLGYVRVAVELMAANDGDLQLITNHAPLIRDAIIRLVGSKPSKEIKSLTSREALRQECLVHINSLLEKETGKKPIKELIFTKYLYQ